MLDWSKVGGFGKGLLGGTLGVLLVLLAVHLYFDHKALHDLILFANTAAPKIQKLP